MTDELVASPVSFRLRLLSVLVVALLLRLAGIDWGLPSATQFFSFHPDEIDVAGVAQILDATGQSLPARYNYGTLTIYATRLLGGMLQLQTDTEWHLICRLLTALLGTATVALTFLLTRALTSEAVALLAAAFLACAPGHVVHSHFATVDVPATCFVVASAVCATQMFRTNKLLWPALASLCAGLAAATKYNMALAFLFAPMARVLLARDRDAPPSAAPASWPILTPFLLLPAALAFILGCPGAVLAFPSFWRDFMYEVQHVRTGSGLIFVGVGPGWWNHLNVNLPFALTTPLFVCSLAGLLVGLIHKPRLAPFLAAFVVPYALVIGVAKVSFLRYTIPLLPFLCLAAAWWLTEKAPRAGPYILIIALLAALQAVRQFVVPDPRLEVAERLRNAEGRIGLLTPPWFYTPPVTPVNGGPRTGTPRHPEEGKRLVICRGWDAKKLERELPEWFVLSEFETRDEERLKDPKAQDFLEVLKFHYRFRGRYPRHPYNEPALPGRSLWTPHDWLYTRPTILVYRRKD